MTLVVAPSQLWVKARRQFAAAVALALVGCQQAKAPVQPMTFSVDGSRVNVQQLALPAMGSSQGRQIKSLLNVPEQMQYGDYVWHEDGAASAGPTWILVNLKAQTVSVFRGGDEIGTAIALYGVDDKPTPTGRFKVQRKAKDYWSRTYDAPMPFSLMLTDDGVAIHGSNVRQGAGTHGCVGVPLDFGSRIFQVMKVGDEVVILQDIAGEPDTMRRAA